MKTDYSVWYKLRELNLLANMQRRLPIRITAVLLLAICLAMGWRGWAGSDSGQRRAGREHSATGARVPQARGGQACRTAVDGVPPHGSMPDVVLAVAGQRADGELKRLPAGAAAAANGRSPPYMS